MKSTTRSALAAWLDDLAENYAVVAPRLVGDQLLYKPVFSSGEIVFDFQRTALSPKTFFLPDTEIILEMEKKDRELTLTEPALAGEQVIFGIRPCDAQGLRALDALLLDRSPADWYYAARRERTILIGLACPQLWSDCFCTSLGSAPNDATAMDLMLYQEKDNYLLEVVTEKGAEVLRLEMKRPGAGMPERFPLRYYARTKDEILKTDMTIDAVGREKSMFAKAAITLRRHERAEDLRGVSIEMHDPIRVRWYDSFRTRMDGPSTRFKVK